jgi:hypothetical protein
MVRYLAQFIQLGGETCLFQFPEGAINAVDVFEEVLQRVHQAIVRGAG